MSNTRKSIAASITIKNYEMKPADIFEIDGETGALLGEIQGNRPTQEDMMAVKKLTEFQTLSFSGQETVLRRAMNLMQKDADNKAGNEVGSTACVGVAWKEDSTFHVTTANLGDSEAYAVVVAETGKVRTICRINKLLHKPNEPFERKRIQETKRPIAFYAGAWRIGGLTVSRAIGDKDSLTEVGDHVPDIDTMAFPLQQGDKPYLMIACDGLFEKVDSDQKKIEFITEAFEKSKEANGVLVGLIDTAYGRSNDNISVVIQPVESAQAVSVAVFDGHGGNAVSQQLGNYFYPVLSGLVDNEIKERKVNVRASELLPQKDSRIKDLVKKAMDIQGNGNPFSLMSRLRTSVLASENKKQTLLERLPILMKGASRSDVLDIFKALEDVNGEFSWIHQQRHPTFDRLRMFFGGHSKNVGEEKRWHTHTYQQAVRILKEAYLKAPELAGEDRSLEEARFIDYRRGNTPKLFSIKKTSTRKALECEAAKPERVALMKN